MGISSASSQVSTICLDLFFFFLEIMDEAGRGGYNILSNVHIYTATLSIIPYKQTLSVIHNNKSTAAPINSDNQPSIQKINCQSLSTEKVNHQPPSSETVNHHSSTN